MQGSDNISLSSAVSRSHSSSVRPAGVQRHSFHPGWRSCALRSTDGRKSFTQLNEILKWWQSNLGQTMDLRSAGHDEPSATPVGWLPRIKGSVAVEPG